jgi:pilus assembly protein CpaE
VTASDDQLARRGDPLASLRPLSDPSVPAAWPTPATAAAEPAGAASGEIVALYSPKGGVGTSFLASRLALAAAAFSPLHTALVDLNPAGGDAPAMAGVAVRRSLLDLVGDGPADSHPSLAHLVELHSCGLEILGPLPFDPRVDQLTGEAVAPLFAELRGAYNLVIADVPARQDDWTVTLIAAADRTLLVTVPERPCLGKIRQVVDALGEHGYSLDHVSVLHNMDDGKGAAASVADDLQLHLAGVIPYAPGAVRAAVNGDNDAAEHLTDDPVGRAVCDLARSLWPAHMTVVPSGRGGRRRRRTA